jgi:hypothetical protein
LGKTSTSRGVARLTAIQSWTVGRGSPAAWAIAGMCSSRFVEPPKGRVHRHGVAQTGGREHVARGSAGSFEIDERARGSLGDFPPDRLPARRERAVRERKTEGLGDNLRRCRSPQKLAAATRRSARAAAQFRGFLQGEKAAGVARADRLHRTGIFTIAWRKRDTAGHEHTWQIVHRRKRHHHRGQTFVASRHAQHPGAARQRTNEPAEDERSVVAIRQ